MLDIYIRNDVTFQSVDFAEVAEFAGCCGIRRSWQIPEMTMSRIIIVSNRVADPGKAAQAGGVAVALDDVLTRRGGVWAGWDGRVVEEAKDIASQSRRKRKAAVLTTSLTRQEHEGFYLGYSNSVLWPVFHNRLDLAQFEAGFFDIYRDVNARFAKLIAPLLQPGDIIWVHDYHFIMLGLELRKLGVENPIGFFLHIPFPPAQSFLAIPEHRELARALSAYELVGLQTRSDVGNFLEYPATGCRRSPANRRAHSRFRAHHGGREFSDRHRAEGLRIAARK